MMGGGVNNSGPVHSANALPWNGAAQPSAPTEAERAWWANLDRVLDLDFGWDTLALSVDPWAV